jgi:hypothetical protein
VKNRVSDVNKLQPNVRVWTRHCDVLTKESGDKEDERGEGAEANKKSPYFRYAKPLVDEVEARQLLSEVMEYKWVCKLSRAKRGRGWVGTCLSERDCDHGCSDYTTHWATTMPGLVDCAELNMMLNST